VSAVIAVGAEGAEGGEAAEEGDEPAYAAAYQGAPGAFSEEAALCLLGAAGWAGAALPDGSHRDRGVRLLPCARFDEVCDAVEGGRARLGALPVENTFAGAVGAVGGLLRERKLRIVGEVALPIAHAVIGLPGATLGGLRRVFSHPVALAQCEDFFRRNVHLEAVPAYDTAGAVEKILGEGDRAQAALAARRTAGLYGGEVLAEAVQDDGINLTRFVGVVREGSAGVEPQTGAARKTTLSFLLAHRPGALCVALAHFAAHGLDLTRIESRPLRDRPFEYAFLIDVVDREGGTALAEALRELRRTASELRVLGSYPVAAAPASTKPFDFLHPLEACPPRRSERPEGPQSL
jgi:prephenate dehydratase